MALNIKIENFEGPFDLLLHLIRKNQMDIYNIKIHEITYQYLQYLNTMKEMDLEITSEFIVIAATLLEIKSKLLLPKEKNDDAEDNNENDPRKELVQKLIEYKGFKAVAAYFKNKESESGTSFCKKPEVIPEKQSDFTNEILNGISIIDLYNIYINVINILKDKMNKNNVLQQRIPVDTFKIEDKIIYLNTMLKKSSKIYFSSIAAKSSSKMELVVTFLAMLEMMKLKNIKVIQEDNFKEIIIERIQ